MAKKSFKIVGVALTLLAIIFVRALPNRPPLVPRVAENRTASSSETAMASEIGARAANTAESSSPADAPKKNFVPVVRVIDGDTITVSRAGAVVTVRLIGIDTPETVDPRKPVQCFGKEASAFTTQLLTGKNVHLEADPTQGEFDKYKRLLAYVFLEDGTNVNRKIIAEGYAHEYTYNIPYRYQVDFKAAEREAREAQRGLWAPGACSK